MKFTPHEYQKQAIQFIEDHPQAGLFLDMGLGKTVITLTAVQHLMYDSFEVSKVLVIAPLRVAWDTWSREAEKWDHLAGLRIAKVLGAEKKRAEALAQDADIYVINRENVAWLVGVVGKRWDFDMVVIDELSSFKSNTSQRFKALKKVRPKMRRVVGLTGTPAANNLMDLWAEMYLLDMGQRLGTKIGVYRQAYFKPGWVSPQGIVYRYDPYPGAMKAISERIKDIAISMKAKDYLELPDVIENTIEVELPDQAAKAYSKMEKEALLSFDETEITAFNAAAVMTKLSQIANGFVYGSDEKAVRIHDAKLDALKEIIEQADGPVLVFYRYREDMQHILEKIEGSRSLETESDIEDWNTGKIPVLLAHPASVGYGLNLQQGGHIIVWFGLTWSLEQYQQANARLHRQGQEKPVLVCHILARGTVDGEIMKSLEKKDTTQEAILEILKSRRRLYRNDGSGG